MAELTPAGALVSRVLPPTPTGHTTPATPPRPSPPPKPSGTPGLHNSKPTPCPKCRGFGWLQYDVPVGHPQFKDIVRCDVCGSGQQQTYLRDLCGLAGEQLAWTFANTKRDDANWQAFDAAQLLAGNPQRFPRAAESGQVRGRQNPPAGLHRQRGAGGGSHGDLYHHRRRAWTTCARPTRRMLRYRMMAASTRCARRGCWRWTNSTGGRRPLGRKRSFSSLSITVTVTRITC